MRLPSALPALLAAAGLALEAAAEASERLHAAVGADASVLLRREASWLSANMSAALQDSEYEGTSSSRATGIHYRFDETKGYTTAGWNTAGTLETVHGKVHGPIGGKFTLQKTFHHLPGHTKVRVEMRYYALETWESGEAAVVKVDGKTIFRGFPRENLKSCRAPFRPFDGHFPSAKLKCYTDLVAISDHTASTLTLAVSCSLDSEWQDEFAAVGSLRIAFEEKCHKNVCEAGSVLKDPPPVAFGATSRFCCDTSCQEKRHCPKSEGKFLKHPGSLELCPDGHCTVEFCCRQHGACYPMLCQGSKLLKLNQPDHCAGMYCTVGECCVDAPRCHQWLCSSHDLVLKAPPPPHCLTHNCTIDECCGGAAPASGPAPGPTSSRRRSSKSGAGRGCLPAGLLLLVMAGVLRASGLAAG